MDEVTVSIKYRMPEEGPVEIADALCVWLGVRQEYTGVDGDRYFYSVGPFTVDQDARMRFRADEVGTEEMFEILDFLHGWGFVSEEE